MSDQSSSEDESSSEEEIEMLATSRERRGNAGAKMASLLNKEDPDDFYKEAYGGFFDEEEDAGWDSQGDSDSDQVDSDFDIDETQEEAAPDDDDEKRPKRRGVFTKAYKELLNKIKRASLPTSKPEKAGPKLEAMMSTRQLRSPHVPRPSPKPQPRVKRRGPRHAHQSQDQKLREAKVTERLNLASLQKFRELETVEKLKRNKAVKRRPLEGPRIVQISRTTPKGLMEHVLVYPSDQELPRLSPKMPRAPRACVVSGLPARYLDPLTKLPYFDAHAFKTIRGAYEAFCENKS